MAEYAPRPIKLVAATRTVDELNYEPEPLELYGKIPGFEQFNPAGGWVIPDDASLEEVVAAYNRLVYGLFRVSGGDGVGGGGDPL